MSFIAALDKKILAMKKVSKNGPEIAAQIIKENDNIVIDLNTDDQLFDKGITADGQKIADSDPYTPFTVAIKRIKGQPTDRVTTRDTEDFHGSFFATKVGASVVVNARDPKTKDLVERYGPQLFGLTNENEDEIRDVYVKPGMTAIIEAALKI